jgi:hypothetical protein
MKTTQKRIEALEHRLKVLEKEIDQVYRDLGFSDEEITERKKMLLKQYDNK